jgi:hypothetical protein
MSESSPPNAFAPDDPKPSPLDVRVPKLRELLAAAGYVQTGTAQGFDLFTFISEEGNVINHVSVKQGYEYLARDRFTLNMQIERDAAMQQQAAEPEVVEPLKTPADETVPPETTQPPEEAPVVPAAPAPQI